MTRPERMNLSAELEVLRNLCRALHVFRSDAVVLALAEQAVRRYRSLSDDDRTEFFALFDAEFGADPDAVARAVETFLADPSPTAIAGLAAASEPRRQEVLRRLNTAPDGTATIVQMRADLRQRLATSPALALVDADFEHLLRSWFNRGFLTLERIGWGSPAGLLEKLIAYEAVHEIRSWDDLRRRLAADRRCYGFFHPSLPGEPLIFIEVALTNGLASSVQDLLDTPSPADETSLGADTAIFYSITNCQVGLTGIPFGDLLIKQVAATIATELPTVTRFSTLSPIPGFGRWLAKQQTDDLAATLAQPGWHLAAPDGLQARLVGLCARYLIEAKSGRWPADPVARFHLRNGARLERINWLGDTSAKGLAESAGLLVNYVYDTAEIEDNHERHVSTGEVICSPTVLALLAAPLD